MNLLEAYKDRLTVADKVYAKAHNGAKMDKYKKIATARCLANLNTYMNEAFNNSTGTQRSDMGMFKKFTMNLVNVTIPNLIAFDLVMVYPMSSISGYITYINYTAGSNKGNIAQGHLFNNPFQLGDTDTNYTSSKVETTLTVDNNTTAVPMKWTPVVPGTVKLVNAGTTYIDDGKGGLIAVQPGYSITRRMITETSNSNNVLSGTPTRMEVVVTDGSGNVVTATAGTVYYGINDIDAAATAAGLTTAGILFTTPITGETSLVYSYNNVVIPQNDLPLYNAEMKALPLVAKARRIAIYYSQIASFQAQTDYGIDMGDQLAEQAVGQLNYEIDTEITQLLVDHAPNDNDLVWSKTLPVGVSMEEHYYSFLEVIEKAKTKIYNRTKRFAPNYMLIAPDLLQIIAFIRGFVAAPQTDINGPYLAGTLHGLKVFVTPVLPEKQFVIGVNGNDMRSSAAVYAPYMPVVPTQLLSMADGSMSQGFSTMYALEMLNESLLVAGRVTA